MFTVILLFLSITIIEVIFIKIKKKEIIEYSNLLNKGFEISNLNYTKFYLFVLKISNKILNSIKKFSVIIYTFIFIINLCISLLFGSIINLIFY